MVNSWKYGEKTSKKYILWLEQKLDVKFPKEYVELVLNFNGASPEFDCYDIPNGEKEKVFDSLISISDENINNVYDTYMVLQSEFGINELIPFANDPFGNYICFFKSNMKIYYYNCDSFDNENYRGDYVADSFSNFISSLYEWVE